MMLIEKTKYALLKRLNADAMLDIRYNKNMVDGTPLDVKQYIEFNSPFNITRNDKWSFSCFVSRSAGISSSTPTSNAAFLYCKQQNSADSENQGIIIFSRLQDGKVRFECFSNDGTAGQPSVFTDYNWTEDAIVHLVVTAQDYQDLHTWKIYVNSVLQQLYYSEKATVKANISTDAWDKIGYGAYATLDYGHNGLVAQACLFNKILSLEEIRLIHAQGGVIPDSALDYVQFHFPLSQRFGNKAWNCVEQYNQQRGYVTYFHDFSSVGAWTALTDWEISGGVLRYAPTGGNLKYCNIQLSTARNVYYVDIEFDIVEAFDGEGVYIYGTVYDTFEATSYATAAGHYSFTKLLYHNNNAVVDAVRLRVVAGATTTMGAIDNLKVTFHGNIESEHATLVNYTDEEAGVNWASSQQVWKDLHSKDIYKPNYFYAAQWYGNSSANTEYFYAPHVAALNVGTLDFEIYTTISLDYFESQLQLFVYVSGGNYVQFTLNTGYIFVTASFNAGANVGKFQTLLSVAELLTANKIHKIAFQKITQDVNNWKILIDDQQVAVTVISNTLGATSLDLIADKAFFRNLAGTMNMKVFETKLTVDNVVKGHWIWSNHAAKTVKDLTGNSDILLQYRQYSNAIGCTWRERKSDIEPVINALQFRQPQSQYLEVAGFAPTSEAGYSILIGYALSTDRLIGQQDVLFYHGYSGSTSYKLFGGNLSNAVTATNNANGDLDFFSYTDHAILNNLKFLAFTESANKQKRIYQDARQVAEKQSAFNPVSFDQITGDLHIAGDNLSSRYLDGFIFFFGIAKGIITHQQLLAMNNNQLYRQPEADWYNVDWQLLINFNRIIDNAGVYTLEDLSGKGHTINMVNFSAANLDPLDPLYALTKIDDLR